MKTTQWIAGVMMAVFFMSCVKDLPFDVEDTDKVVVNCILTNHSVQTLNLTRSVKITDSNAFKEIKEAQIVLQAGEEIIGEFEWKSYGNWQLRYLPVPGTTYQLSVLLPDGTKLTATTMMPEKNRFYAESENNLFPNRYFRQQSAENACWIFVLSGDEIPADLMYPAPSGKDRLHPHLGTDHPQVDRFNGDGNLFDLIPQATTPAYSFYIRIQPFTAKEEIPFCLQTNYGNYSFVYFRTASKEYDQYLKSSLQKMFVYQSEDDPVQWFDESPVYSNIINGTGIFAACNDDYFFYIDNKIFYHENERYLP